MPANTVKIDRSTRWGNPFKVGETAKHPCTGKRVLIDSREKAIELFSLYVRSASAVALAQEARQALRGKNLACWCKQGLRCHGDVLLAVANATKAVRRAA